MTIDAGRNLLHYRLTDRIGEGGMGVVWKAVDTTLNREVAIKVLPADFASDPARLSRFEREARLLASLSHPNIAVVHGLHEDAGVRFLVMELASGEDLSRWLSAGPLPPDEALAVAAQIADALEAAHDSGVIHRDLKPANIHIDTEGAVKVLDFGLAKAFQGDPASPSSSPTMSPTVTSTGTLAGTILGTAAYMSPEQAKAKVVDKRADIWAFGCVLLEMLTGRQVFQADSVAETLAHVIKEEPPWDRLPPDTPPRIRRLLQRCLVKDPRRRLRDIGDARIAIAEVREGDAGDAGDAAAVVPPPSAATWPRLLPWGLTLLLGAALLAVWFGRGPSRSSPGPGTSTALRLSIALDEAPAHLVNGDLEIMPSFALSPAGDSLVYTVRDPTADLTAGGERALQRRTFEEFATRPLRGTEDAEGPFFSPDGRWIGFFDGTSLAKVPASGGARIDLVSGISNGCGADWSPDGAIVFAHSYVGPLWTVPDSGGEPRPLTTLGPGERSHRYPQLLPDGRSVLFTIKPTGILSFDDGQLAVADLKSGEHHVLAERGSYARYVRSGHLVYARQGALLAAPFDLEHLRTTGGAVPVVEGVMTYPVTGTALFDVAADGTLVYVPGDYSSGPAHVVAVDRDSGAREPLTPNAYTVNPRLSPDGRRLLMHGSSANDQVLMVDLERGTVARLTDAATNNILPIWSPSGERIVFSTDRSGGFEIVSRPVDGGALETLVPPRGTRQAPFSWSADGTLLAFGVQESSGDIWILDTRTGESTPYLQTPFHEGQPTFSPDGRWIAYESDESGRSEIYAGAYPGPGSKIQLSTGGGNIPRWRADGAELYYQSGAALVAVPVTWNPAPRPGPPRTVVELPTPIPLGYDVTPDGNRFYITELDESRWAAKTLNLILNWSAELQ